MLSIKIYLDQKLFRLLENAQEKIINNRGNTWI